MHNVQSLMQNCKWLFIGIVVITLFFGVPVSSDNEGELCQSSITGEWEPCFPSPSAMNLYNTDYKDGTLDFGQSMIYPFAVSGERIYLEWILFSTDCASDDTSVKDDADGFLPCVARYNLYVYHDCDPSVIDCPPLFSSIGNANAYIGISSPQNGSIYYAEVEALLGSGSYRLITRSYTNETPIITTEEDNKDIEE